MVSESGASDSRLTWTAQLQEKPYEFDFFWALRILEAAHPEKPRLGTSARIEDDPVRLGQTPSLAFAPATFSTFSGDGDDRPPRLEQFFFGLFGPNGPLPLHLTEYVLNRLQNYDDPTLARFADIFHHRLLTLFYRIWASSRPSVQFDRPETDQFARYVGSLIGLGIPGLRNRDDFPDLARLYYAGALSCQARHAEGLITILAGYFQLPFALEEFVGQWLDIPSHSQCRLGSSREWATLGQNAILGPRVWDCQYRFRIVCGPLDLASYSSLLPGGEGFGQLVALVRNYVGEELDWELQLVLSKEYVPALRLGADFPLGRATWVRTEEFSRAADDLVLQAPDALLAS
jgi:type VI secretion system protein ImpH